MVVGLRNDEYQALSTAVRNYITDLTFNDAGMDDDFTEMVAQASAGDMVAKDFLKYHIRQFLEGFLPKKDSKVLDDLTFSIFADNWGLSVLEKYDTHDVDEIILQGTRVSTIKNGFEEFQEELDKDLVMRVIRRCLEFEKIDISESNPTVEAARADGSRITAIIPPVGMEPSLNIRKFDSFIPTTEAYLEKGVLNAKVVDILDVLIKGRANIIVFGEMGSGKTTLLKWLVGLMPSSRAIGTLESTFELNIKGLYPERRVVALQESGDLTMRKLFPIMLRTSVDCLIVGEARSYEISELLKAMTRGQRGSLGTAHSISAEHLITDIAVMLSELDYSTSTLSALKLRVVNAVNVSIYTRQLPNGRRYVSGIYEYVVSDDGESYTVSPLVEYEVDDDYNGDFVFKNRPSASLIRSLNANDIKMSRINEVFSY